MTKVRILCISLIFIGFLFLPVNRISVEDVHREVFPFVAALESSVNKTPTELSYTSETAAQSNEGHIVEAYHIDVDGLSQYPEYVNGCEITSLAMLTNYMKLPYSRQDLIDMLPRDETPLKLGDSGAIEEWGDPNHGFVGDITGKQMGYGVYNKPIEDLLNQINDESVLNLTGGTFTEVEEQISKNHPVLIWTTSNFKPSESWVEWHTQEGSPIEATFEEHAVLMVGYDQDYVYVNNPMNGEKAEQVAKQPFIESWEQLGEQAITINN